MKVSGIFWKKQTREEHKGKNLAGVGMSGELEIEIQAVINTRLMF